MSISSSIRLYFLLASSLILITISPQQAAFSQGDSETTFESAEAVSGAIPQLLASSESGVSFALTVGHPTISSRQFDGQTYQLFSLEGFSQMGAAGEPDLPQLGVPIALPPGAVPIVRLLHSDQQTVAITNVLPAVTRTLVSYDYQDPDSVPEFEDHYEGKPAIYETDALFPQSAIILGEEGSIRDQRFVNVMIRPVQINPTRKEAIIHANLEIQVEFVYPDGQPQFDAARPESPTFERIMAGTFLNYEQAANWRQLDITVDGTPKTSPCMDENSFRVNVVDTGIHELGYSELIAAGFPGTVAEDKIRMCHMASEIDIHIENQNGSANFGAGDSILFFAEELHTQETDTNVYWLTYSASGPNGQRMATSASAPGGASSSSSYAYTEHLEDDNFYLSTFPMNDENDHWYWNFIYHGSQTITPTHTVNFPVNNLAAGTYTVPLTVNVIGHNTIRDHSFEVRINGAFLGSASFRDTGRSQTYSFDFTAASSQMVEGNNVLEIEAIDNGITGQEHFMWVDWIDITPRRQLVAQNGHLIWDQPSSGNWSYSVSSLNNSAIALDVTDPLQPEIVPDLTGSNTITFDQQISSAARYAISTTTGRLSVASIEADSMPTPLLQDGSNNADYIFISAPSLLSQLLLLTAHRESQGYTVAITSVQDIFDEFNYGIYDTSAIQSFLAYAYSSWNPSFPAPSYVNLVGESSYDHRDIQGLNGLTGNLVPTYLKSGVDSNIGETASDNEFANFDSDLLPEMHIGRLPAETEVDLAIMVDRIIEYDTQPLDPVWMGSHLFVADNAHEIETGCDLDPAGDFFATVNDFIIDVFPTSQQRYSQLFYAPPTCYPNSEYPVYEGHYRPTVAQMQIDIATEFSKGHTFITYTGHSASTFWSKDGSGFLNPTLVHGNLFNGNRTPIMLSMTCLTGSYHRPERDSLDEELLKRANGGAVAAYSPTGLQVQQGHDFLIHGFYDGIYVDGYMELAEAVFAAKLKLYNDTFVFQDLHDTFMLLGDPTTNIRLWEATDEIYLPTIVGQ